MAPLSWFGPNQSHDQPAAGPGLLSVLRRPADHASTHFTTNPCGLATSQAGRKGGRMPTHVPSLTNSVCNFIRAGRCWSLPRQLCWEPALLRHTKAEFRLCCPAEGGAAQPLLSLSCAVRRTPCRFPCMANKIRSARKHAYRLNNGSEWSRRCWVAILLPIRWLRYRLLTTRLDPICSIEGISSRAIPGYKRTVPVPEGRWGPGNTDC